MGRISQLESLIKKYATLYYSGESEVSDEYFDELVEELRSLDPDNEILHKSGWGYSPNNSRKIKHLFGLHIGSLSKIKKVEDFPSDFTKRVCRISAKLDGLSIVSYYEKGKRFLSLTRGDGFSGLDVTDKISRILKDENKVVKFSADGTPFTGAIRGEVVMPLDIWNTKYLPLLSDNNQTNPRNVASGIMCRNEVTDELDNLRYVVYKVLYEETGNRFYSLEDVDQFLSSNFNNVVDMFYSLPDSFDLFRNLYNKFSLNYPCDGLVVTYFNNGNYNELAYKFEAESKTVTVKEVKFEASRTGRIVPVVHFDNVVLSGANVKKCTGYNAEFIRENQIGPGSVIRVCRSNEVIPTIVEVIKKSDNYSLPNKCPNCGGSLNWSGCDLVCEFESESQLPYRFITTICPIDGAGWSLYSKFIDHFKIDNLQSLVSFIKSCKIVDYSSEVNTHFSGSVTRSNILKIIECLKSPTEYGRFLVACNIKGISWKIAYQIIDQYPEFVKEINNFNEDKLWNVQGIGWKTIKTLRENSERISSLSSCMTFNEPEEDVKVESTFSVAITGALSVKRSDFIDELSKIGVSVSSNFKEIKYLITNTPESGSSKMKKAKENNIEIISEEDFIKKYFKGE